MSIESKERLSIEVSPAETVEQEKPKKAKKKSRLPQKRTMNLFYKPDRTTKPATIALYVLFVLVCLLGLGKFLVYDLWAETRQAQQTLAVAQAEQDSVLLELADYNEVRERYQRYSATDEEQALIDRMEVLALLDSAVGTAASMNIISISGDTVQIQFSGVTLAQTAQIVHALEASPIVERITVNTASTTQDGAVSDTDSALVQTNVQIYLQKEAAE